jgi:hypothetical protein
MTGPQILINLLAYACFGLGTLVIWPSRRNVVAWLGLPFFVIAYLIPLLVVDYREYANPAAVDALTTMNFLGALAMLAGMAVGAMLCSAPSPRSNQPPPVLAISDDRVFRTMLAGCLMMSFCFAWMGFLPIFAEQPFLAKFFKGEYKEKYDQVSVFYRLSQVLLATALPLAIPSILGKRSKKLSMVTLWAVLLFAASLNRGTVVAGAVLVIAAWASTSTRRMVTFLVCATVLYSIGSSVYALLGIIIIDDFDVLQEIARGAPDIKDHLAFLGAFNVDQHLSYGFTFFGGLLPGNFYYNPSVFTLAIVNDTTDISEIASGGFRLPPSIAGYAAFSWLGVVAVPLVSGLIAGYFTSLLKRLMSNDLRSNVAAILWFQIYASFWIAFYAMAYQAAIAIFVLAYVSFRPYNLARQLRQRKVRPRSPQQVKAIDSNAALGETPHASP